MRFWTIVYPDITTAGIEFDHWETLSDQDILDYYWDWWSSKMREVILSERNVNVTLEDITEEKCIEDWCIVHWASRNHWREIKEYYE